MTVSVWPSMTGETPLQHYNTCFSMAHIQENVDASINFQNDTILKCLNKMNLINNGNILAHNLGSKNPKSESDGVVTMRNLNEFIVSVLKSILMP